ncbi:MAG: hypothetical protein ACRC4N_08760 [Gammaproteobacteria bacterium]
MRKISLTHVEAIRNASKTQSVKQMLSFLGMAGFSRAWICDFALKVQIKAADQTKPSAPLTWTAEGEAAFDVIKGELTSAPALASPDYTKPFQLYVS